ncbi:hypothetical protein CDAR_99661 [Caerostris darwini]|uniref:Uncharacterized protein n=1 Tax=Caerostris darwini TaxID=1538125 RepID=A0AAV4RHT7_9ARAC|nr:hypothetical protein CDAR_99661 [Caerostris darwini]
MRFRISDFPGSPGLCKIYANADWEEIQAQGDRGALEQNRLGIVPGSPELCKIYANADWEEIQAQVDRGALEQNRLGIILGDLSWISWKVSYCECWIPQWGIDYFMRYS